MEAVTASGSQVVQLTLLHVVLHQSCSPSFPLQLVLWSAALTLGVYKFTAAKKEKSWFHKLCLTLSVTVCCVISAH